MKRFRRQRYLEDSVPNTANQKVIFPDSIPEKTNRPDDKDRREKVSSKGENNSNPNQAP